MPKLDPLPEIKDAQSYEIAQSFSASESQWPTQRWWVAYNDPQLNDMIFEALNNAPDLAQAQARILNAEGLARQAGVARLPSLDANASVSGLKQSYNNGVPANFVPKGIQDTGRATLDFNYEIDFWGKNKAALAAATSDLDAARAEAAQTELMLSTSIVAAYADLAALYADLDSATQAMNVRKRTATLVKERYDNGLENIGRWHQAQATQASSEADIEAINESIALNKNRIAALIGKGPDRGLAIEKPTVRINHSCGLPAELPVNLIGRRPDIVAARLRAEAAMSRITQTKASFYPNINLSAYAGVQSLGLDLLTKSGSSITSFGPAINLPLFDGGLRASRLMISHSDYQAAVASYDATLAQALQDVADVSISEKYLDIRKAKIQEAFDASKKAHDVANNRYKGGLATFIDVLTAEDAMIANHRALADIQSREFILDVALTRALGGGFNAENKVK